MKIADRDHVARRLEELRDWATYIHQSLSEDQRYEQGKVKVLQQLVGDDDLSTARDEAKALVARLNALIERVETPATAVAP